MKTKYLLLLPLCLLLSFKGQYSNNIKIKDAVENNYITYKITGKKTGTHYTKALTINIQNISPKALNINIPNGQIMVANDSDYQNFIITNEVFISLAPGEEKEMPLYAMCIEKYDAGPGENQSFRIGDIGDDKLRSITAFIQKNKFFQTEAQYAIWAVTDNYPLDYIAGYDTSAQRQLLKLTAEVTNQAMPTAPATDDYMRNYYDPPMRMTIGGEFEYKFSQEKSIAIAMFDTNNIVVRELFNNPQVKPGQHRFTYEFDGTIYTDDVYFIKLIVDGEVRLNLKLDKI